MSPVTSLVLLLASSYVSSLVAPELYSDTSIVGPEIDEELAKPGTIPEKPGSCPAEVDYPKCNPLTVKFKPECFTDKDCNGTRKCCTSGCTQRCLLPLEGTIPEKPGSCPAEVDYPKCDALTVKVKPECFTDKDCNGTRKCCTSGCTQRCLLPLEAKLNRCPCFDDSRCIFAKPSPYECHSDSQCQGTDRCCFTKCQFKCVPTETVKPGQCPAPKKKIIARACTKDCDCTGDKKCCEQKGLKCVTPEKEHPGVCPNGLQDLSCSHLNKTLCSRDSDCLPEQKCCLSHGNILQCTAVKNEKPGSCPIPITRCKTPLPKPLCNSDRDCLGQQKCCTPVCRQQCTDPDPNIREKECPVVATFVKCGPYPPAECADDSKCGPGQKCCDVGCRIACTDV
ncbi:uncharacterized protein [Dendrobates tinctorius]|uniref:uncharacterized protein n=1 Tax=Dendrobates tinctorius TaxID=92724 RepID=UPI003CC98AED